MIKRHIFRGCGCNMDVWMSINMEIIGSRSHSQSYGPCPLQSFCNCNRSGKQNGSPLLKVMKQIIFHKCFIENVMQAFISSKNRGALALPESFSVP